ncbi:DUF4013 domain-containing protein [Halocalculus aciditolerans]|uniref:DUF4013 domain-containing protein n=1 Tax=Halocalculus aciditolerans TaxID=1383812 RepID=A0A830F9I4_9EURY|nr:DUF4013 domain-containing protein [Halocalculus aciditolerans]GGL53267.1 hypothetical protein GCM10009039_09340 [Halocalculus aciditolerans]
MFEDALNYPREGDDWLTKILIGGGLQWVAAFIVFVSVFLMFVGIGFLTIWFAVVPGIVLAGYTLDVARSVLDSDPEMPAFEDWQRLFVDGLKVFLVGIVYGLPLLVLGLVFLAVAVLGGRADVGALVIVVFFLVAFAYSLAVTYVFPVSLVNMAREDDVAAAFDFAVLSDVALDGDYAVGWLLAVVVKLLGGVVNSILGAVVVGFLLVPLVQFYTRVSGTYLLTRGFMDVRGIDFDPDTDHQTTLDEAAGSDAGLGEGEDDDSMPEAQTTVEPDSDVDDTVSSLKDVEQSRPPADAAGETSDEDASDAGAADNADADETDADSDADDADDDDDDSAGGGERRDDRSV